MKKSTNISDFHFEHLSWLNDRSFEKLEFIAFQRKLEEFTPNYNDKDTMKRADYFQNNFLRHNEIIDIIKHGVNIQELKLSNFAEDHVIDV